MAKLLKLRRGTTTQHGSFTGAEGEVTVDTDKETLVVHDGSTAGGHPVAAEDMANVSSSAIAGRLSNDSLATSKLAAGALPSDVTVASANLVDGTIATADIADAAVTNAKLGDNSVTAAKIGTNQVTATELANDAVGSDQLATGALQTEHCGDNQITTAKIVNNAVDFTKIQDIGHSTVIGRAVGSAGGNPAALTATQVRAIINVEDGATADQSNAEIRAAVEAASDSNVFTDADHSKLNGIEASATAEQTAAEIRTLVESASDSNVFTDADHSKLNGIEASATADQTNAEIRAAVEAASDSNVFTDADHSKLNGIEASATADQTGSEIASALNGQNIYTTGVFGRDSTDYIGFANNAQMDIYINGNNEFRFEADGDFHADGDVIAQSTTISSDRRLKENIEPVSDALKKVQALNGVSFDWKKTGEKSAGVIAQEVIGVLPEAVKEVTPVGGGESHLAVNYHALTSILIEAIKELKAELDEHKGGK